MFKVFATTLRLLLFFQDNLSELTSLSLELNFRSNYPKTCFALSIRDWILLPICKTARSTTCWSICIYRFFNSVDQRRQSDLLTHHQRWSWQDKTTCSRISWILLRFQTLHSPISSRWIIIVMNTIWRRGPSHLCNSFTTTTTTTTTSPRLENITSRWMKSLYVLFFNFLFLVLFIYTFYSNII